MRTDAAIMECAGRVAYSECIRLGAEAVDNVDELRDATFLITGASGMVGSAICRTLLYLNRTQKLNIRLVLPVRASTKKEALRGICGRSKVSIIACDLTRPLTLDERVDYIIHAACPTGSNELKSNSAEVSRFSALSTLELLDFGVKNDVKGFVYLSSMEVYGAIEGLTDETKLGFIDLTFPRSCYPESKRFCENLIASYAAQHGLKAVSARLAQVLGAGIKPGENRAYAAFARRALKNEAIVLKTDGTSHGNYVHIADAVSAILFLLTKGAAGQAYNVSSDNASLMIKDFARRISSLLSGGKSEIIFDIPKDISTLPYASHTGLVLDNTKLKNLGWQSRFTLDDMIVSLGKDLTELNQE